MRGSAGTSSSSQMAFFFYFLFYKHLLTIMRMYDNRCVMKRVTVILSDEEYVQVRREAGLIPLSAWFRSRVIGSSHVVVHSDFEKKEKASGEVNAGRANGDDSDSALREEPRIRVGMRGAASVERLAGKCPHHHERGELCYKCDPKFGVPNL